MQACTALDFLCIVLLLYCIVDLIGELMKKMMMVPPMRTQYESAAKMFAPQNVAVGKSSGLDGGWPDTPVRNKSVRNNADRKGPIRTRQAMMDSSA